MRNLLDRIRWVAVPLAVYVAITLVLPLANGAAGRASFVRHASWVIAGCVAIVVGGVIAGLAIELVTRIRIARIRIAGGRR